jgi:hypothetical protein
MAAILVASGIPESQAPSDAIGIYNSVGKALSELPLTKLQGKTVEQGIVSPPKSKPLWGVVGLGACE